MDRRTLLKTSGAALLSPGLGHSALAAEPYEITFNSNLVTVGNSLIDQSVDIVYYFASGYGRGTGKLTHQTIPGSPMKWNWQSADVAAFNAKTALRGGGQNVWMGVESVPFRHVQVAGDVCDPAFWKNWYDLAIGNGVTRFFVFEAWHDLQSGSPDYDPEDKGDPDTGIPWRERIDFARDSYLTIVELVNSQRAPDQPEANLIPGGTMLGVIYDDIAAGRAPEGLNSIEDLFIDTIHPNIPGRYAMACIMYACIYRRDPAGLPTRTQNQWGQWYDPVPPQQAAYFQELAWEIAQNEPYSGLMD